MIWLNLEKMTNSASYLLNELPPNELLIENAFFLKKRDSKMQFSFYGGLLNVAAKELNGKTTHLSTDAENTESCEDDLKNG